MGYQYIKHAAYPLASKSSRRPGYCLSTIELKIRCDNGPHRSKVPLRWSPRSCGFDNLSAAPSQSSQSLSVTHQFAVSEFFQILLWKMRVLLIWHTLENHVFPYFVACL